MKWRGKKGSVKLRVGSFLKYVSNCFYFIKTSLSVAATGLRCCTQAFSSCCEWGPLFVALCRLLIAASSLMEHGL